MFFEVGLSLVCKEVVKFTFMQQSDNICAMLIFTYSKSIVCTFEYQKAWIVKTMDHWTMDNGHSANVVTLSHKSKLDYFFTK